MKRSVVIWAVAVVLLGLAGTGWAVKPVGQFAGDFPSGPFVAISFEPDELNLGALEHTGPNSLMGVLTAHIVANCPFNVRASFSSFKRKGGGGFIPCDETSLTINGVNVPISGRSVSVISSAKPTPAAGVDVPLECRFTVGGVDQYRPGTYEGTLTFTIAPGA
jgi:hypothetical protein